ncbi:MAG: hypothetical protein JXA93_21660 [Anaerolineae bacterium]|nr:hypothetical protein [Anaerolineae bacterium]
MNDFKHAQALLHEFKGNNYLHGFDVLPDVGQVAAPSGATAALVRGTFPGSDDYVRTISQSLERAGVAVVAEIKGARPNAPREDDVLSHGRAVAIMNPYYSVLFAPAIQDPLRAVGAIEAVPTINPGW